MNQQELLASFQNRGLRAWQASFAASFLDPDSSTFHFLVAPPGTGKTYVSVAIAAELVKRQAKRILVLSPASLCDEWTARLTATESTIPVLLVTRRMFREMEAALPIGQSPWKSDGIYVISLDLAKQDDFAIGLSAIDWDLVIVDEAHHLAAPQRAALLDRVLAANAVRRLLLLSATPLPALDQWFHPMPDQAARFPSPLTVTSWYGELKNWDGSSVDRPNVKWEVCSYRRSADEVKYLSDLFGLMPVLESASGGNRGLTQSLTRCAGSSLFTVEQTLQRLERRLQLMILDAKLKQVEQILGPLDHILDSGVEGVGASGGKASSVQTDPDSEIEEVGSTTSGDAVEWADLSAGIAVVKQCLDSLDRVSTDEKLNAMKGLIRSIMDARTGPVPKICVFSLYADTVSYLYTAIDDIGLSLFKMTAAMSFTERQATVERFLQEGGLIIGTDGAILEGIAMPQVTDVVHYDLPVNPLILEQRRGRFDRFGRDTPLTMHLLLDESGTIPFESHLINKITSEQRRGIDDVLPTIDPLKKPSE